MAREAVLAKLMPALQALRMSLLLIPIVPLDLLRLLVEVDPIFEAKSLLVADRTVVCLDNMFYFLLFKSRRYLF